MSTEAPVLIAYDGSGFVKRAIVEAVDDDTMEPLVDSGAPIWERTAVAQHSKRAIFIAHRG